MECTNTGTPCILSVPSGHLSHLCSIPSPHVIYSPKYDSLNVESAQLFLDKNFSSWFTQIRKLHLGLQLQGLGNPTLKDRKLFGSKKDVIYSSIMLIKRQLQSGNDVPCCEKHWHKYECIKYIRCMMQLTKSMPD